MSIQSEITRITNNVQETIDVIEQTGVSIPAGANSDNLSSLAQALANEKQDKLTGTKGQVVGFNAAGEAVAQDAPESGITQTQADSRYLRLSGGTMEDNSKIEFVDRNGNQELNITGDRIYFYGSRNMTIEDGEISSISSITSPTRALNIYSGVSISLSNNSSQISIGSNGTITFETFSSGNPIKVTGIAEPENENDATNKAYVDSKAPKYQTVTLTAAGWSANTQTVTVSGVLADESAQLIQPMPAVASQNAYISSGVICSGQAANQLTFTCTTVPTEDLSVYVVIQGVSA